MKLRIDHVKKVGESYTIGYSIIESGELPKQWQGSSILLHDTHTIQQRASNLKPCSQHTAEVLIDMLLVEWVKRNPSLSMCDFLNNSIVEIRIRTFSRILKNVKAWWANGK